MDDDFLDFEWKNIINDFSCNTFFTPVWFEQEIKSAKEILQQSVTVSSSNFWQDVELAKKRILKFLKSDTRTSLEIALLPTINLTRINDILFSMQNCNYHKNIFRTQEEIELVKILYTQEYIIYLKDLFLISRSFKAIEEMVSYFKCSHNLSYLDREDNWSIFLLMFEKRYTKEFLQVFDFTIRDFQFVYTKALHEYKQLKAKYA